MQLVGESFCCMAELMKVQGVQKCGMLVGLTRREGILLKGDSAVAAICYLALSYKICLQNY